jgi:hypothetical protein
VGGWTTTVVAFVFMRDFSPLPWGTGKKRKKSGSPEKIRRWGNRSLVGSDLDRAGVGKVMAGADVLLVARIPENSVAMIERVYGHFRNQSYQEAQARLDRERAARGL